MSNINILKEKIEKIFKDYSCVTRIKLYQKKLVCIKLKTLNLYLTIDVNANEEIDIVLRDIKTKEIIENYFLTSFDNTINIVSESAFNKNFLNEKNKDVSINLRNLVEKLLEVNNNLQLNVIELNKNLNILLEQTKLQQQQACLFDIHQYMLNKQKNILETLELIKKDNLSVVRFGDGEIRCMVTKSGCSFQKHSWHLMAELMEISSNYDKNILVCYPSFLAYDDFWLNFWSKFWYKVKPYIQLPQIGDAMITRPEAFFLHDTKVINLWKEIFKDKSVCFVTGESSRLNKTHDLFSNIKKSLSVYSKNNDAYDEIELIITKCLEQKDIDIFLVALGPTGTALAYRLAKLGKRAIDIGHMSNSYDTVYKNMPKPEKLIYKRV